MGSRSLIFAIFLISISFTAQKRQQTYYEILKVSKSANANEIKSNYRKMTRIYHPDKNKDNPEVAKEMWNKLDEARDVLTNKDLRRIYDNHLSRNNGKHANFDRDTAVNNMNPFGGGGGGASFFNTINLDSFFGGGFGFGGSFDPFSFQGGGQNSRQGGGGGGGQRVCTTTVTMGANGQRVVKKSCNFV